MVVAIAQQSKSSRVVNLVKIIAAYLEREKAITKSTALLTSLINSFKVRQLEILLARTVLFSEQLEAVLVIWKQLDDKIGLSSTKIVYRVLLNQMRILLVNVAKCYGSYAPPVGAAKVRLDRRSYPPFG